MTNISSEQVSSHRVGLLVLGMHRSGTSALTRLLNIFGCSLPVRLIGANHGNEDGHWESATIAEFNDAVLDSAGSSWNDCQAINPDWFNSLVYAGFASQARELLLSEFGNSPLFVFKDPRTCRLARLWLEAFDAEAIKSGIVVPLRHPDEVADSLERRDNMGLGYGRLLWLRHVLDAEAGTRGRNRIFTTYHELLADWRGVMKKLSERFDLIWPRNSMMSATEADEFLRKRDLRADASEKIREGADLVSWLNNVYSITTKWSILGEDASDYPLLDRTREEFDRSISSLGMALLPRQYGGSPGEGARQRIELEVRLAEAATERDNNQGRVIELEGLVAQLRQQLVASSADFEALTSRHGEVAQALADRQTDIQHLRDQLVQIEDALSEREVAVIQLEQEREELRRSNAYLSSSFAQRGEELERAYIKASKAERQVEEDGANHRLDKARLEMALAEQGQELALVKQERDAASSLAADFASANANADAQLVAKVSEVAGLVRSLAEREAVVKDLQGNLEWMRRINVAVNSSPLWWGLLLPKHRRARHRKRLKQLDIFDSQRYLAAYPDVAQAGVDPLKHYMLHGMAEGRHKF